MQWPIEFDEEDLNLFVKEWKLSGGRADNFHAGQPYGGALCWVFYRKRDPMVFNVYYMKSGEAWRRVDWGLTGTEGPPFVEA